MAKEENFRRFRTLTTFLCSLKNSDAIFSMLHQKIYERYPAADRRCGSITVSPCLQLHSLSSLGLQLLALAGREEARLMLHKVKTQISPPFSSSLLLSLASLEKEQMTELEEQYDIYFNTEEEGVALVSLLERCAAWRVGELHLVGEVGGQTWQREAEQGGGQAWQARLLEVRTRREVVGRGRREDLRAVWGSTEVAWVVDGEWIRKRDGEEEGWGSIEMWIL